MKTSKLLSIYTSNLLLKFGFDIQSQIIVMSPETERSNMTTRWPLLKINKLLSMHTSNLQLKFGLYIQSQTKVRVVKMKNQYDHQAAILKVTFLKIIRLWSMTTSNMHMKFGIEIPKQTWVTFRKTCHLQSPDTKISNMAAKRSFWRWHCWKSIVLFPYV